jgi:hypothetical protein
MAMAISLSDLKKVRSTLPPRLLIYGVAGIGKTSLAAEFPNAVFLQTEEGTPGGTEIDTFGVLSSYGSVVEALGSLYSEDHDFQTVVLDSLDALEPMVWAETCSRNNWRTIEDPGYGKGYLAADGTWREFIDGCNALRRDRGMTVIWLAHSAVDRFEQPGSAPYNRYDLRLQKRGAAILTDEADAILFMNTKVSVKETDAGFNKKALHAEGGGTRWLFTDGRPAFIAKNRYGLPDSVMIPPGKGYAALAPHLPGADVASEAA